MNHLALIFILIFASGCSGRKPISPGADRLEFATEKAALKVLGSDQVNCQGECSPAVGAFYLYHKQGEGSFAHEVRLCSFSLISKNRVLTNKHCIEDVLKAGDLCDDHVRIEFKFPKTKDKPFSSYKCRRVVSTSEDYFFTDTATQTLKRKQQVPDWAVIELTENVKDREPVKVAAATVDHDHLPVTLFPVYFNFEDKPATGVIRQVSCERVYNKGGTSIFTNDSDSPLFRVEKCSETLVPGNSGAGVFYNNSTELLGVMDGSDGKAGGRGTTAHCVPDFAQDGSSCLFPSEQDFTTAMKGISFLNRLSRSVHVSLEKMYPWSILTPFQWEDSLGKISTPNVRFELKAQWSESVKYFEKKGSPKLARRYIQAFQTLVLPRLPKCYMSGLASKIDIPLADMASWSKLNDYKWAERIDGERSIVEDVSVPAIQVRLRPVAFSLTQKPEGIVAHALEKDLPEPVRSLQILIPSCP